MNNNSNQLPASAEGLSLRRALRSRWLLPSIAGLLLLALAASVPGYHLHIDEGWIGEQSYFLSRDGYVHSTLFEGFAGNEIRTVVYHRLFVMLGGWSVGLFGWGIWALRALPLLCGALLMGTICRYLRLDARASWPVAALGLALFLLMPLNFTYIKVFRPEMLMALCGFGGYCFLSRYAREGRWRNLIAAALAGGLATLAHPYGMIFPAAGLLTLLRLRAWRGALLFGLCVALPAIPYAIDIATHYDLFHAQISNPLVAEKTGFTLLSPFVNLLNEHKRLFRKPETILPTTLFILSLIVSYRRSRGERRFLQTYTILLVLLLGAVAQDKVVRYAIPLLPFFIAVTALTIGEWMERPIGNRYWRWAFGGSIALFILFGLFTAAQDIASRGEHVAALNSEIAASIPPGTRCLAPMNFIFDEIARYPVIALRYANMEHGNRLTVRETIDFADRHHADAIIMNSYQTLDEGIIDLDTAMIRFDEKFRVVKDTPEYKVLLRR